MDNISESIPAKNSDQMKYCKHCGAKIPEKAVICTHCGCQVEDLKSTSQQPNITINNTNSNTSSMPITDFHCPKNKWVAFVLCLFVGFLGAHKFYEGRIAMGILYLFTGGLLGIGWIVDCITLLCKPNPYYV